MPKVLQQLYLICIELGLYRNIPLIKMTKNDAYYICIQILHVKFK